MFDTIGGVPLHPLVIHAVVVLGPVAALGVAAFPLLPRWQRLLRWPTLALAAGTAAIAWVAVRTGEWLRDTTYGDRVPASVAEHAEAGELAAYSLYGLLGASLVVTLLLLPPGRTPSPTARLLAVAVALVAAGIVGWAVFEAGHSGAVSVWGDAV